MEIIINKDKHGTAKQFCEFFIKLMEGSKIFHVALSGGSTPKVVFDYLADAYGDSVDWGKVRFYWGDERCVPPTDEQSNYKMAVDHLFSKIDVPNKHINRIMGESLPPREAMRYADLLVIDMDRIGEDEIPQFDLIILGMGDDGHTASIFPEEIQLWDAKQHCVVATHPQTGQKRITITGGVINTAKNVAFLVTGESKAEKVKAIINKEWDHEKYPASLVAPVSGNLTWFLDDAAAAQLNQN